VARAEPVSPSPTAEDLYRRHGAVLYRFFRRMTGRGDVAEDLVQELFARVVQALPRYRARDRERAWLFEIARNLLTDRHRAHARRPEWQPLETENRVCAPHQGLQVSLDRALLGLSELDRAIFLMREVGGFGYLEIGEQYGLSPDAVRNRIRRARTTLRDMLADELRLLRTVPRRASHDG
jgi:RNA polymerase sigma-70 factor, ECF subfamily